MVVAAYTIPSALVLMGLSRALNLMAVGEETASYLGTDVERVKKIAYGVASLMTAAGVAVAGIIGFVGLIIPHALRLLVGSDQRVPPASFLPGRGRLPDPGRSSGPGASGPHRDPHRSHHGLGRSAPLPGSPAEEHAGMTFEAVDLAVRYGRARRPGSGWSHHEGPRREPSTPSSGPTVPGNPPS